MSKFDPYWYWPQCDVKGCKGISCCNGTYYRPGYWCLCWEHSDLARAGAPKPEMWAKAVKREAKRLADGTLKNIRL